MSRHVVVVLAVFFTLHALVHFIGFAAYWRLTEIDSLPYKTAILHGRLHVGDVGMRVLGAAFLAAGLGFLAVALGMALEAPWWRALLIGATLFSLVITLLDWQVAYAGALIDGLILAAIVISERL
jgi:hypothetical protein